MGNESYKEQVDILFVINLFRLVNSWVNLMNVGVALNVRGVKWEATVMRKLPICTVTEIIKYKINPLWNVML